jgi:uncharacterized protein
MAITRERALALLHEHVTSEHLLKHSRATEAIMRALAVKLGHDSDLWGITGLLHDLDFDVTKNSPEQHTIVAEKWLLGAGCDEEMLRAIKSHNAEKLGIERDSLLDFALTAAETITGLIVAATLVQPDKKLSSVKPKSITKRMKEKQFAAAVNRDHIMFCERLGISIADFAALSLDAMKDIAGEVGL